MGRAFTLGAVEDCLLEEKVEGRVHNSGDSPLIVAIPPDDCKRVLYTYTIRHQTPLGCGQLSQADNTLGVSAQKVFEVTSVPS